MPLVGFESTNPAFERAKTVHAFDRAATVITEVIEGRILKRILKKEDTRIWITFI
jgi:hypothetical protein